MRASKGLEVHATDIHCKAYQFHVKTQEFLSRFLPFKREMKKRWTKLNRMTTAMSVPGWQSFTNQQSVNLFWEIRSTFFAGWPHQISGWWSDNSGRCFQTDQMIRGNMDRVWLGIKCLPIHKVLKYLSLFLLSRCFSWEEDIYLFSNPDINSPIHAGNYKSYNLI